MRRNSAILPSCHSNRATNQSVAVMERKYYGFVAPRIGLMSDGSPTASLAFAGALAVVAVMVMVIVAATEMVSVSHGHSRGSGDGALTTIVSTMYCPGPGCSGYPLPLSREVCSLPGRAEFHLFSFRRNEPSNTVPPRRSLGHIHGISDYSAARPSPVTLGTSRKDPYESWSDKTTTAACSRS